jgi:prevent-host-death family protein
VKKTSLANAKAHLSKLGDEAEHHRKRIIILRHGKPAAAIVPVALAVPPRRRSKPNDTDAKRSIREFIAEFSAAEPRISAVDDLMAGRR